MESIPDTPEGIILEAVLEGMAEYYSVQLATNVKRGMDNVARKGQSVGGTIPLGHRTGPDKHLELDPKTAPPVKRIFEMYAAGKIDGYTSSQKSIYLRCTQSYKREQSFYGGMFLDDFCQNFSVHLAPFGAYDDFYRIHPSGDHLKRL